MEARFPLFENEITANFIKRLIAVSRPGEESPLSPVTEELVKIRASQINGCGVCTDMHTKDAAHAGESAVRLNLVAAWREASVFTEAERAALAFAEEGTRIADAHGGVGDETWAAVRKHYDDDQIGALITLLAAINAWNRLSVLARTPAGDYQTGAWTTA